MITFLLAIIAVLLFVIASKFAPEELSSLVPIVIIGAVVYLIFQYWQFIIAIPFVAFYGVKWFVNTDFFATVSYGLFGIGIVAGIYFAIQRIYKDLSTKEGRLSWKRSGKEVAVLTGKILLYSVIGTVGLIALMFILIFLFVR